MDERWIVYVVSDNGHWIIRNGEKFLAKYNFRAQNICCEQARRIVAAKESGSFILDLENASNREEIFSLINFIDVVTMRGDGHWPTTALVSNTDFARLATSEKHDWLWVHASGQTKEALLACIEHALGLRKYSHYRERSHRSVLQVLAQ